MILFDIIRELNEGFDLLWYCRVVVKSDPTPEQWLFEGHNVKSRYYCEIVLTSFESDEQICICLVVGLYDFSASKDDLGFRQLCSLEHFLLSALPTSNFLTLSQTKP